jgi:hypothetical protein
VSVDVGDLSVGVLCRDIKAVPPHSVFGEDSKGDCVAGD